MSASAPSPVRANESVLALFKKHFGYTPPHVVRAPAWLELLGHHSDYHEGLVLSVAVDRYTHIACAPRSDGKVELVASANPSVEMFWVTDLQSGATACWSNAIKGVLAQLRKRGVHFSGFNAALHHDLPSSIAAGSSTALGIATMLAVRQLYPFGLGDSGATLPPRRDDRGRIPPLAAVEKMHFARIGQAAASESAAGLSGLLSPVSTLCGKAWHATAFDCRFNSLDHLPLIGEVMVLCDSGVRPESSQGETELRELGTAAARKLGAKSLRSVEMKHLQAERAKLTLREYACAYHVVGEIARVVAGERALRDDDHRQFGQYLFQSHESSRNFLRNSTTELDLLVALARAHRGCLGARLTGGGFGGATISLVAYHEAQDFITHMAQGYERALGMKMTPLVCQVVDGAA